MSTAERASYVCDERWKALAAFVPTLVIAYAVFGIFLGAAALFAHP